MELPQCECTHSSAPVIDTDNRSTGLTESYDAGVKSSQWMSSRSCY